MMITQTSQVMNSLEFLEMYQFPTRTYGWLQSTPHRSRAPSKGRANGKLFRIRHIKFRFNWKINSNYRKTDEICKSLFCTLNNTAKRKANKAEPVHSNRQQTSGGEKENKLLFNAPHLPALQVKSEPGKNELLMEIQTFLTFCLFGVRSSRVRKKRRKLRLSSEKGSQIQN